jgi:pilus assembly protein Flp/PilA
VINPFIALYVLSLDAKDRIADLKSEKGATAVEYGLMVGLIAVAIIAAVILLGGKLTELFTGVSGKIPTVPGAPAGTAG